MPLARSTGWVGYLAPRGFEADLRAELGDVVLEHGRLMFAPAPVRDAAWAQNVWLDPVRIEIASITDAVRALRAMGRDWVLYAAASFRRAHLIEAQLRPRAPARLAWPAAPPARGPGSWTLVDRHTLIAAPRCSSPFPHGEIEFVEDKSAPPSRAYLKLWELFTRTGMRPGRGDRCLDLGASPGGWTWAIQQSGARVIAVDKAPLAAAVARLPRVEFLRESAFAVDPGAVGPVDWWFCDVACTPSRALALIERWRAAGAARRMVCTIKFQGEADPATARRCAAIAGSRLMHLHHNKHELTWMAL
jgi:23S rRNA (cytidine2498-2'-O)-methyltransferase